MANPYSFNAARAGMQGGKNQVSLGSSDALKRFEKIQARQSFDGAGSGKFTNKDSDSDESLFKNANKFMKQKKEPVRQEIAKTSGDDSSDIELSILDAPKKPSINQVQQQQHNRPTSRAMSAMSVASSVSSTHRRSQSKVKFYESDQDKADDQSIEDQTVEDLFSRNLVLDIQDLDSNDTKRKSPLRKHAKSPMNKRSESIVSIIEEKEEYSSLTPSIPSPSLLETNLILDIDELEKSVSKSVDETVSKRRRKKNEKQKEERKSERKKSDSKGKGSDRKASKQSKESKKQADKKAQNKEATKHRKKSRSRTSTILSNIGSESSISTEIISEISSNRPNEITDTTNEDDDVRTQLSRADSRSVTKYKNSTFYIQSKSYYEDFETDQDVTFRDSARQKKQLSFASDFNKTYKSAEIQVDSNDLLKYSDLLRSVNAYNPSSLLLASVSHLHDQTTLRELNQITGYNLINQSFNDLIKMNLNFMRNFLNVQRTLYEQQIQSIQPK